MKQIGNLAAIITACFIIKTFPKIILGIVSFIALLIVILWIKDILRKKRIKHFMNKNDKKGFIFYSSNKRLKPTIEKQLKPLFDFEYGIIYNNRNIIESDLDAEIIDYLQNQSIGFKLPILYKITKEKIIATSFYEDVYEFKEQRIIQEVFKTRVNNKLNKQL